MRPSRYFAAGIITLLVIVLRVLVRRPAARTRSRLDWFSSLDAMDYLSSGEGGGIGDKDDRQHQS
jgi:hypothetical protein